MIAMTAMIFTTRFSWTVKGLGGRCACRVSAAIPAIVVLRADGVDDTLSFALHDKRAGDYHLSGRVLNGNTFATDHGLIHRESMGDREVDRSALIRSPDRSTTTITVYQLGRVDDPQLTVPAYPGAYRKQRTESLC